jgi:FkbM family methyltransferase
MRTQPRCVFIDLGAADGNTFNVFMSGGFGPLANCPSSQWSAVLVEANPNFNPALINVENQHAGAVRSLSSTAAYMCEAHTSFYLDPDASHNHWGSTMNGGTHSQQVTVPTMNLIRLLYENTISADWVIVKMDIEGAEYDILPCLAAANPATLIDQLYMEQHYKAHQQSEGLVGTTYEQMEAAKNQLRARGIQLPDHYFSNTL